MSNNNNRIRTLDDDEDNVIIKCSYFACVLDSPNEEGYTN
jgi:hypothetical protein